MEKRQAEKLVLAIEKIATTLEKIETTLDRGLINDVSGEAYLWDIYLAFHKFDEVLLLLSLNY